MKPIERKQEKKNQNIVIKLKIIYFYLPLYIFKDI